MRKDEVPQDGGRVLSGGRKAVYAQDEQGRLVPTKSSGWEPEEVANLYAVHEFEALAETARQAALAGQRSPLEFHMYRARMDLALLAQTSGLWRWRIRRHFRPDVFAGLSERVLSRYAEVLGCSTAALRLPETP